MKQKPITMSRDLAQAIIGMDNIVFNAGQGAATYAQAIAWDTLLIAAEAIVEQEALQLVITAKRKN